MISVHLGSFAVRKYLYFNNICFQIAFRTAYHCWISADVRQCVSFPHLFKYFLWLKHFIVGRYFKWEHWIASFPVQYIDIKGQCLRRSGAQFSLTKYLTLLPFIQAGFFTSADIVSLVHVNRIELKWLHLYNCICFPPQEFWYCAFVYSFTCYVSTFAEVSICFSTVCFRPIRT